MPQPDHFSQQADFYAQHRPTYPEALFDWLVDLVPEAEQVWDVGTGNGQAALALAKRFPQVLGTDLSASQIARAPAQPNLQFATCPADQAPLPDQSVDLITVAQALHWFAEPSFFAEVQRVAKPGAYLVVWTYALPSIQPAVDEQLQRYFHSTVGPYWPPQRRHVDEKYANILFPLERISPPEFQIERLWTLDQLLGYLRSWSATQRYVKHHQQDPVREQTSAFEAAWGDLSQKKSVIWPLTILAGKREIHEKSSA